MIRYDELTFPEVEQLPRSLHWLLPLGRYTPDRLAGLFPEETVGLLPAVPYGYRGSFCEEVGLLGRILDGVRACLAEDGFARVTLVSAEEQPWETVRAASEPESAPAAADCAVVPIGHTEQHGYHLPLATDTLIVEALGERMRGPLTVLPAWPYGVSMHRREFAGTLSTDARAFEDFWVALGRRLGELGFQAVYLLNGHGGNHSFLVNAVKYAGDSYREPFVASSFLHTSSGPALEALLAERRSQLMGHACELETSYVMAVRPELVHLERAVDEVDFICTANYSMDWVEGGALIANPPWTDDTLTGSYGAPSVSTLESGRRWLQLAAEEQSRLVEEILEQARRRRERRALRAG